MPKRILRMAEVVQRIGRSKATIYRLIKLGQFPRPISLGPQSIGFLESEVEEYIDHLAATRADR